MCTIYALFTFLAILLFFNTTTDINAQQWKPLPMHGGGYTVGLAHHPTDANTLFARIDIGGIYIMTDQGAITI